MTLIVTVDTLLYWLDKIKPSERSLVGDRAFYLSQQAQAGRAVIPGFAIAAPALRQFLATNNWSEPLMRELLTSTLHINVDNAQQLKGLAVHIREELCQAELPETWVNALETAAGQLNAPVLMFSPCLVERVTSREVGATPSSHKIAQISGLLESRICRKNRDSLTQAWKETWAELFSARSLFYWQRSGISLQDLDLAILVQPVWNAIASGSLETRGDIWEIKSTWGLGISISAGKTIPDYYQVNGLTGAVEQQILGKKLMAYHVPVPQDNTDKIDVSMAMNLDYCQLIQPLILDEKLQEQFALPEPFLSELIQLTKTLVSPLGERLFLAWMICPAATRESQNLAEDLEHLANLNEAKFSDWQLYLSDLIYLSSGQQPNQNSLTSATDAGDYLADVNQNHPGLVGVGASPGEAIGSAFVISDLGEIPVNIPPKSIIVIKTINVDALFCLKEAAGVIAEQGGMTSHAAILARELGIPAVVGVSGATEKIKSGQILLINGERGKIFPANSPIPEISGNVHKSRQEALIFLRHKPDIMPKNSEAKSVYSELTGTQVMVNLSQVKCLENLEDLPVDGVGLLRSELMILDLVGRPNPQKWIKAGHQEEFINLMTEAVTKIARYFFPRPVFYRSCDLHSDPDSAQAEKNPALGIHGAFSYLLDSSLFELELTVLERVQADGYTNINLILPFVRTVEEFVFCRQKVAQNGLEQVNGFQLWIMAEVPSILFLLEDYIKAGVQGIAIGTNDLTQLLLGVDRNHPQFQHLFENPHGAVKRAINQLINLAKSFDIPCSICGQAVVMDPQFIENLVHWGVTIISVEPISFATTYRAIARSEKRLLLEAARRQLYS